jgi:hypothetical protein
LRKDWKSLLICVLPVSLWLVLAKEPHQEAMRFTGIVNELAPVVEALAVDADDFIGDGACAKDDAVGWQGHGD